MSRLRRAHCTLSCSPPCLLGHKVDGRIELARIFACFVCYPRFGCQVRLVAVEQWSHAQGLSTWKVPAPDFQNFRSFSKEEVDEEHEELWCRNGGPLAPTMFPPKDPEVGTVGQLRVMH